MEDGLRVLGLTLEDRHVIPGGGVPGGMGGGGEMREEF